MSIGRELPLHQDVYESEAATNQRNQALASLMHAYGVIEDNPAQATDIYTKLGSLGVNALDLATMAGTLANGGVNPRTGKTVMVRKFLQLLSSNTSVGLVTNTHESIGSLQGHPQVCP